jgi:F-type H+-transporting ATPase subunit a
MVSMLGVTILIWLVSYFATRKMKQNPVGLQNVMEKIVETLHNFFADIIGTKYINNYFPFLATLFLFIFVSNFIGLLPFAGHIPGFTSPTSSINVTAALALCTFSVTHYSGVKHNGFIGYLKHFTRPFLFMLPMFLIDELIRPLSLTLRLYGNIFGDEMVVSQFFNLFPLGLPLFMQLLSVLICFLQAIIFVLLTSVYIGGTLEEEF